MKLETFFEKFDQLADAPNAVAKMRELVLELAVQGKLVPQDSKDEPAAFLVRRAADLRQKFVKAKIVRDETADFTFMENDCGELPLGWAMAPLGIYTAVIMGQSPPSSVYNKEGLGLPFYQGKAQFGKSYPVARDWCTEPTKVGEPEDVVISVRAPVGPTNMLQEKSCIGRGLAALRGLGGDQKYLLHALRAFEKSIASLGVGSTFTAISKSDLDEFILPVPPLAEQKRIVAKVDELMALCDRLDEQKQERETRHAALARASLTRFADAPTPANLHLLFHPSYTIPPADLRKSILSLAVQGKLVPQDPNDELASELLSSLGRDVASAVRAKRMRNPKSIAEYENELPFELPYGWEWSQLGRLTAAEDNAMCDGPFGSKLKTEHYIPTQGYAVIRLGNIGVGQFIWGKEGHISREHFESLANNQTAAGDLIVAGLANPLVRCCEVPPELGPAVNKADCFRVRLNKRMDRSYIRHYLNSPIAKAFAAEENHGMTRERINLSNAKSMPVPIPPLAEQRRIVAKVDQLMALVDKLETQLAASRTTAGKLMEALVTELTA